MVSKIQKILIRAGFRQVDDGEFSNGNASIYINGDNAVGIFGENETCEIFIPNAAVYIENKEVLSYMLKSIGLWNSL